MESHETKHVLTKHRYENSLNSMRCKINARCDVT